MSAGYSFHHDTMLMATHSHASAGERAMCTWLAGGTAVVSYPGTPKTPWGYLRRTETIGLLVNCTLFGVVVCLSENDDN